MIVQNNNAQTTAINDTPRGKDRFYPAYLSRRVLSYYRSPYRYLRTLTKLGLSYAVTLNELTIAEGEVYYFYRHGTCELITPLGGESLWPVTAMGAPEFIQAIPKASCRVQQHWLEATDYAAKAVKALTQSNRAYLERFKLQTGITGSTDP